VMPTSEFRRILSFCDAESALALAQTCRRAAIASRTPEIWRSRLISEFGVRAASLEQDKVLGDDRHSRPSVSEDGRGVAPLGRVISYFREVAGGPRHGDVPPSIRGRHLLPAALRRALAAVPSLSGERRPRPEPKDPGHDGGDETEGHFPEAVSPEAVGDVAAPEGWRKDLARRGRIYGHLLKRAYVGRWFRRKAKMESIKALTQVREAGQTCTTIGSCVSAARVTAEVFMFTFFIVCICTSIAGVGLVIDEGLAHQQLDSPALLTMLAPMVVMGGAIAVYLLVLSCIAGCGRLRCCHYPCSRSLPRHVVAGETYYVGSCTQCAAPHVYMTDFMFCNGGVVCVLDVVTCCWCGNRFRGREWEASRLEFRMSAFLGNVCCLLMFGAFVAAIVLIGGKLTHQGFAGGLSWTDVFGPVIALVFLIPTVIALCSTRSMLHTDDPEGTPAIGAVWMVTTCCCGLSLVLPTMLLLLAMADGAAVDVWHATIPAFVLAGLIVLAWIGAGIVIVWQDAEEACGGDMMVRCFKCVGILFALGSLALVTSAIVLPVLKYGGALPSMTMLEALAPALAILTLLGAVALISFIAFAADNACHDCLEPRNPDVPDTDLVRTSDYAAYTVMLRDPMGAVVMVRAI
jgi:hypothetical protein